MTFSARLFLAILACVLASPMLRATAQLDLTDDRLKTLDREMKALVETQQVANLSYGLWQNGELLSEGHYGPVSGDNGDLTSDTTIHRIYSMTKPITAIGLLILMERGAFDLDDPITKILPEFGAVEVLADHDAEGNLYTYRPTNPPTMRQLLSHTAGFAYGNRTSTLIDQRMLDMHLMDAPTSDALISQLATLPYARAPGSEWQYSIASDLQGAIIERLTGETLNAFLKREVFDPLGMADTGFYVAADKLNRLSDVTQRSGPGLIDADLEAADKLTRSKSFFRGGDGLFSTQRDYARFLTFLRDNGRLNGRALLRPKTLQELRTNAVRYRGEPSSVSGHGHAAGLGYGFGVGIVEDSRISEMAAPPGSYYWTGTLGTWFWVDPENDVFFIGMVQTVTPLDEDILRSSMHLVYGRPTTYAPDGSMR